MNLFGNGQAQQDQNAQTQALNNANAADKGLTGLATSINTGLSGEGGIGGTLGSAAGFYQNEMQNGLAPGVVNSMYNQYDTGASSNIASIKNQYGNDVPNLSGTLGDLGTSAFMGREALGGQIGQLQQETMANGAAGLAGVGEAGAGITQNAYGTVGSQQQGVAQQYGQAAQQAEQSNPWNSFLGLATQGLSAFTGMGGLSGLNGLFNLNTSGGGYSGTSVATQAGLGNAFNAYMPQPQSYTPAVVGY